MRDPGSVTYSAAIESAASRDTDEQPSEFAQRVDREARRRGFDHAPRRVVLGDGAPWIWNLADEQFPGATQIVDLYHAKQHLSDVAKAIYGKLFYRLLEQAVAVDPAPYAAMVKGVRGLRRRRHPNRS